MKFVFSTKETIHYRFPTHVNDLVIDRKDAETSEVFIVVLEPGEAPPLHIHHDAEQIFYVLEGKGLLQISDTTERQPVQPGDVVRVPPHTYHRIFCDGNRPLRYLSVDCFVGAKSNEEPTWESHVRALCEQNGWDFEQVKSKK
jgi:mannose-6-phosphate isomerase-like protein (cupin superfamily)